MGIITKLGQKLHRQWVARQSLDQLKTRLSARRGVLTLCYHALDRDIVGYPYTTSAAAFDAQITFLRDIFDIVPVQTAIDALGSGQLKTRARPMAVICFDDGYRCNWTQATPVLERHAVPAILFAPRDLIRQPGQTYLSEPQLKDLAAHPLWQVGAHGVTHNVLPGFLPADQSYEINESHDWLADLLGVPPDGFAYPQGQISAPTVAITQDRFAYAFSTDQRLGPAFDIHQIRRFCPTRAHDTLHSFARDLVSAPMENGHD